MKTSDSTYFLIILGLAVTLFEAPCHADITCNSEISYTWVKDVVRAGASQFAGGSLEPPTPAPPTETVVYFGRFSAEGRDEVGAKEKLDQLLVRAKVRASDACRREHENLAACTATKMQVQSSVLNSLGFTARRELESAIVSDCKNQLGRCTKVESSEAKCAESLDAEPTPTPAPAAEKKNEKKKK